jgi:HEAT repeat protein
MSFFNNLFGKAKSTKQAPASPDVKTFIAKLANADGNVQKSAADSLVAIGEPAVDSLISVIESGSWQSMQAALWALGEIGSPQAVDAIAKILQSDKYKSNPNDKDQSVRQSAATALGKIGGDKAVELLSNALNDKQEHRFVQMSIVNALKQIGTPQALEAMNKSSWRRAS